MNTDQKIERLNRTGRVVEDVGLTIQHFTNAGNTRAAQTVALVNAESARKIEEQLEAVPAAPFPDRATQVLEAAERVLEGSKRIPLVRLGQGDYTRDIHAQDIAWGRPSKLHKEVR